MWIRRKLKVPGQSQRSFQKRSFALQKQFQWRYTLFLVFAVFLALLVAGGPTYYFLNQNYQIFIDLAYNQAPELLEQLERERTFINGFLYSTMIGILAFCFFLGFRMTSRIAGPLTVLQNHLKKMIRGEFYTRQIRIRQSDEFHELIDTYNYFCQSLQKLTQQEWEYLRTLQVDPRNQDSMVHWKSLVHQKARQLNENPELIESAANAGPAPSSRHVS